MPILTIICFGGTMGIAGSTSRLVRYVSRRSDGCPSADDTGSSPLGWLVVGALTLAAAAFAYAVLVGDEVESIDLGPQGAKVSFQGAAGETLSPEQVRHNEATVEERLATLESEAMARADPESAAGVERIAGIWDARNGFQYVIQQFGDQAVIQEQSAYGITASGTGTVRGPDVSFQVQAVNGVSSVLQVSLVEPGLLRGTLSNQFGSFPAELRLLP
ncbi:MAG: hypothetical protein GXX79_15185 [Actinomycetales bacterium]|nr:hypothetical protein [Actinomycetales bacterium]